MPDWFQTGTASPSLDGPTGLCLNHTHQGGCNYFAQWGVSATDFGVATGRDIK